MSSSISIIGTGDYAKALAHRLLEHGYQVYCGSRHPDRRDLAAANSSLSAVKVVPVSVAIEKGDIVFVAIHADNYDSLELYTSHCKGKIVVDISNPARIDNEPANVEKLQSILPNAKIVKGFNTISAYSLESQSSGESKTVHICGNDQAAKEKVTELARNLGFSVTDHGGLTQAKEQEKMPLYLFREWQGAAKVTMYFFIIWLVYGMARYLYIKKDPYDPERIASNITNKAFACTAMTILAITYLPGCLAGILQMINGTKHKRFPDWLDNWMKMRKQLGLFALFFAGMHMIVSVALMSPAYFKPWYTTDKVTMSTDGIQAGASYAISSRMNWLGETVLICGVISVALMVILGLTSIQAIGDLLNWREWTFIHSYLGYSCLFTAACHVTIIAVPDWLGEPWYKAVQRLTLLSSILPWLTLLLKLGLSLPAVNNYLWKIRRGWERGDSKPTPERTKKE